MPPSASVAPASHFNYSTPTSRRVVAVTKGPTSPSHSSNLAAHPIRPATPAIPQSPRTPRQHTKQTPPSTPSTPKGPHAADGRGHARSASHSSSAHTPTLPRFHVFDFNDASPSVSPKASPTSPKDTWQSQAGPLSPYKPPSPTLNHTNTFYRMPTTYTAVTPTPAPLLSPTNRFVSGRSLDQLMAAAAAESSMVVVNRSSSSMSVYLPPPPSPSSRPLSPSFSTRSSHYAPSLNKAPSLPSHTLALPPLLPSPARQVRTVSSPVVKHSAPSAPPPLSGPPAPTSPSSALAVLHASHVFVKTSSSLLSRWQKRWLMLTQHRSSPFYRLALYTQPGQAYSLDTLHISTSSTVTGSTDRRKQCRLTIRAGKKELIIDCVNVAEKTAWSTALKQAALLTHHSASALSPTASRALSFPPPSSTATASALTSWQQFFFHLYYALPEVGYVHARYDAAMAKFRERFIDEQAIVRFLLDTVKEEARREQSTDTTAPHEDGAVYVNESPITAYLSAKFGTTSLPTQLLNHALADNNTTAATHSLQHPAPSSDTRAVTAPINIDPINQAQLLTAPGPAVPTSPSGRIAQAALRTALAFTRHTPPPLLSSPLHLTRPLRSSPASAVADRRQRVSAIADIQRGAAVPSVAHT